MVRTSWNRRAGIGLTAAGLLLGGITASAGAQQDITYGGDARAFAMGGAGIAIPEQQAGFRQNPATLAFELRNVGVQFPSLALRSTAGPSQGRVSKYLFSGQDFSEARNLAIESAAQDSEIGANGSFSVRYSHFEIGGQAVARGRIQPNASLTNWASVRGGLPADVRSDIFAAGYYTFPTVAAGFYLPDPKHTRYSYGVGVRLKYLTSVYTHYIADQSSLSGRTDVLRAPEMNGSDALTKKAAAIDLGLIVVPARGSKDLSAGIVLANAVRTPIAFEGTDRNGNSKRYNLLVTTLSGGLAYRKLGFTLAADWVDLTQNAGKMQVRTGGEYQFPFPVALRGGYNTANGFTYGFGFYGLDVAFGKRQPLEVIKTINF